MNVREMFASKIEALLEKVPLERRTEAEAAVARVLEDVPSPTADKAAIGKFVGPRLKEVERMFVPPERSLSKEEKLRALHAKGAITDARLAELIPMLGEPGVGKAIEGAYGQLTSTTKDAPLVSAYTMIEGFMFERSRARIARSLGYTGTPYRGAKVHVSYIGITRDTSGARTPKHYANIAIDNDVPLVPERIWETKRYTRLDYGTHDETYNQLFKYQAAIAARHFNAATLEVYGNISPDFLRALLDHAPVAPGLYLEAPDVEVLYVLDEQTAIPLRQSRSPVSLARGLHTDRALPFVRALAMKRYELFSGMILDADADAELASAVRDGKVDPKEIQDPRVFRRFEELVWKKRLALLEGT